MAQVNSLIDGCREVTVTMSLHFLLRILKSFHRFLSKYLLFQDAGCRGETEPFSRLNSSDQRF